MSYYSFTVEEVIKYATAPIKCTRETAQLTKRQIRALMDKPANIRNMSVIAHGMSAYENLMNQECC